MSGPSSPAPAAYSAADGPTVGAAPPAAPVAVVWCRQVDNEAESPGYSSLPEEFPGQAETLETIRIVGNLTINVADTHDYWDPDPGRTLSYYPNVFLYPAYHGRYTCLGRMFLSTEDRPRLGMKTLVLDTRQLLENGEFGPTVLRWHASMGGPGAEAARPAASPDPHLYPLLGEGFLFHRGTTDPLVVVAADQWPSVVQVVLDLLRVLPGSLTSLGAVLAFPYFLPQAKTNLHEFAEELPLALAVMRVGRGEAYGDRHNRRVAAWSSAPVGVRDLTKGLSPAARGRDPAPLVLQLARDHQEERLAQIAERVDLVELPRLTTFLADHERQGGRDRRKEMWRIGTAMESAALLLQRPRARPALGSGETAKRANEYLNARREDASPANEPSVASSVPPPLVVESALSGQLPAWLQRPADAPAAPPGPPETVPVSRTDDPSRLPPRAPAIAPVAPLEPPVVSVSDRVRAPAPPAGHPETRLPVEWSDARQELERTLLRYLDDRFAALREQVGIPAAGRTGELPPAIAARLAEVQSSTELAVAKTTAELESRLSERIASLAATASAAQVSAGESIRIAVERRLAEASDAQDRAISSIENQLALRMASVEADAAQHPARIAGEVDRRIASVVEPRLANATQSAEENLRRAAESWKREISEEFGRSLEELRGKLARAEEELRTGLSAQIEIHLRDLEEHASQSRAELETLAKDVVAARFAEFDQRHVREIKELEQRFDLLYEGRTNELTGRFTKMLADQEDRLSKIRESRLAETESRWSGRLEERWGELSRAQERALAEVDEHARAYSDERFRTRQEADKKELTELAARLRTDTDAALGRVVDTVRFDQAVRDRIARGLDAWRKEHGELVDGKLSETENRFRAAQHEELERLEQVESRVAQREEDLLRIEQSVRHELDELDRRTQVLSDRLVPVVRQAWLKISEFQKAAPGSEDFEVRWNDFRREMTHEIHRVERDLLEQNAAIRERIEGTIENQGRVWLTLAQQLTALTQAHPPGGAPPTPAPAPAEAEVNSYDDFSEMLASRGPFAPPPAVNPLDPGDVGDEEPLPPAESPPETRTRPEAPTRSRRRPAGRR